jgi:hypothetical protein
MARLQVIGEDVFYNGEKVAELRPGIPTSNHFAFLDFLRENEYSVDGDDETPDIFKPEAPVIVTQRPAWSGIPRA